jgi:tRNA U34 2-thiouridine synthase MnmA/TrmU
MLNEKTLSCTIEDNGVGRKTASQAELTEKKRSLAISFIEQRLSFYSKLEKSEYKVIITDKFSDLGEPEGTIVILTIPIIK